MKVVQYTITILLISGVLGCVHFDTQQETDQESTPPHIQEMKVETIISSRIKKLKKMLLDTQPQKGLKYHQEKIDKVEN